MSAFATLALLAELRHADHIIKVMLNAMTLAQKSKCATQLEAAGVSPDGMTRAHERAAVIAAATAERESTAPDAAKVNQMFDLAHAIRHDARNMRILLQAAVGHLAKLPELPQPAETVLEAVQCFTSCAVQCADLIHDEAFDLLSAGGVE